jgi:hypothetical protein
MSELFDSIRGLAEAQVNMYRAAFNLGRESAHRQDDENKQRIESEDIPAKMIEDLELEQ